MKGMNYDDWQAFLDERETGPGWQWPLNLAVAMHLAVFGSAVMLQNMTGSSPGLKLDNAVMVNFISLSASALPPVAAERSVPAAEEPPLVELTAGSRRKISLRTAEPGAEVKPEKPLAKEAVPPSVAQEVKLEPKAVKKEAAPVLVRPAPKTAEPVKPLAKTAAPVALAPAEPVKKTAAPAPVAAPAKEVVSLKPVQPKKAVAEEKAREQAKAAELKRQAELAEAKKQEAVKAAKLETEKKAAEAKRVADEEQARKEKEAAKIAAAKKEQAKIAEAAKAAAEKRAAAAEARKKLAEQERQKALAEARRVEREAAAAREAAVAAREQLVRALRENMAVSTAAAGSGSLLGTGMGSGGGSGAASSAGLNHYARQLNEQISSRWKVPELTAGNRKLKTVVALTVNKNGTIEDLQIERKSGDPLFDQSVVKALRSAPLPRFFTLIPDKDRLEFALNFTPQGLTL
ncbi:cell envelope integrity protein TolA [Candidatus Electronema sp. JC]|uniref:cell envelope integrity protein TolA n=1 Tax=Candidatus Electronema sp. JC TaxID=3401570 RepID=UPI003B42BB55